MIESLDVKGPICRRSEFQAKIQADTIILEKSQVDCEFLPLCIVKLLSAFNVRIFHSEKNMYHRMHVCFIFPRDAIHTISLGGYTPNLVKIALVVSEK